MMNINVKTKKWLKCAGVRAVKTAAQTAVALIPAAVSINAVDLDNSDRHSGTCRSSKLINQHRWTSGM